MPPKSQVPPQAGTVPACPLIKQCSHPVCRVALAITPANSPETQVPPQLGAALACARKRVEHGARAAALGAAPQLALGVYHSQVRPVHASGSW